MIDKSERLIKKMIDGWTLYTKVVDVKEITRIYLISKEEQTEEVCPLLFHKMVEFGNLMLDNKTPMGISFYRIGNLDIPIPRKS